MQYQILCNNLYITQAVQCTVQVRSTILPDSYTQALGYTT